MLITLKCTCGKCVVVNSEKVGATVPCPKCKTLLDVTGGSGSAAQPDTIALLPTEESDSAPPAVAKRKQAKKLSFSSDEYWFRWSIFRGRLTVKDAQKQKVLIVRKRRKHFLSSRMDLEFFRPGRRAPFMRIARIPASRRAVRFSIKNSSGSTVGKIDESNAWCTGYSLSMLIHRSNVANCSLENTCCRCERSEPMTCGQLALTLLALVLIPVWGPIAGVLLVLTLVLGPFVYLFLILTGRLRYKTLQFVHSGSEFASLANVPSRGISLKREDLPGDLVVCMLLSILFLSGALLKAKSRRPLVRAEPVILRRGALIPQ